MANPINPQPFKRSNSVPTNPPASGSASDRRFGAPINQTANNSASPVSDTASRTQFSNGNNSIFQSQDLGSHIQEVSNVKGSYGNWGQNPTQSAFVTNDQAARPQNMPLSGQQPNLAYSSRNVGLNQLNQNQQNQAYQQQQTNQRPIQAPTQNLSPESQYPNQFQANPQPYQDRPQPIANLPPRQEARQPRPLRTSQVLPNRANTQPIPQPQNPNGLVNQPQQLQPRRAVSGQVIRQGQPQQPPKPGIGNFFSRLFAPPQAPVPVDKNSKGYLAQLSPSDLRKEVIQTEIEIQKTLIDSEKAYREGVSTIRDLIAPSSVKVSTGFIELGTKMVRTFFVLVYPRAINSGWLEGLVNADIAMDLSLFIYPRDSSDVLKELKGKVGKIQASLQLNSERGAARDPQLETAYRDVEGLRDAIQQGVEKFFRLGVYVTIYASNADELEKVSQSVEGLLAQQNIKMKRAALQMDDGFNSSLPILKDDLNVFSNMNTSPLSASFPFVSSELSSNDGILYGINRHNTSLIIFDRFDLENANSVVFATSGAGKSYTVKLEILRSLMLGINVIVIDPEQEYKILADTLGGAYVNMSLNSSNRINPFDLPRPLQGESTADILRTAIIDLMGLMNLMLGKLNPSEESIMERAIQESYAKRDITVESDLTNVDVPTMSDLVEILNGIVGGESLSQRLYRYTEGTFAGVFNQRTNININNDFIVFNIRDLQEQLRPIAMYVLLKYIWNEIRTELKKRILAIDEAWILMQYEDSARFLFGLAKRARKYYLGITTITQDVGDFLNSPFGKPIVTNAAMKILLKQSTAAIDLVAETFALTAGEKQVLLQSEVGQGIFFAGPRHVAIEIIAFPTEHRIITTNPKDIIKMQGFEDQNISQ